MNIQVVANGPSWTDVLAATSTCGLLIATVVLAWAAIRGGTLALEQLRLVERNERLKNTFSLVKDYLQKTALMSPLEAYDVLANESGQLVIRPGEDAQKAERNFRATVVPAYIVLWDYLDEADDLYQRNLIDRDFFLRTPFQPRVKTTPYSRA
jgi:hypothetical protein